jgi:molybdopterin molybdotransferase
VTSLGIVGDDRADLAAAIGRGLDHDLLLLSGGVSVGKYDHVERCLREAGVEILFNRVRIKPGKPVVFGVHGRRRVFGLPGNPVSSFVAFELFVRPMVRLMQGHREIHNRVLVVRLQQAARNRSGRRLYLPARITEDAGDAPRGTLIEHHGSADLRSLVEANGLLILPEVIRDYPAGILCEAMVLPGPPSTCSGSLGTPL